MFWIKSIGVSLLLTLFIELAISFALGKRGRMLLVVAMVNLLTNPLVVIITLQGYLRRWPNPGMWVICLEIVAAMSEALIYRHFRRWFQHPVLFSLLLNGLSFGLGVVFQPILSQLLSGGGL